MPSHIDTEQFIRHRVAARPDGDLGRPHEARMRPAGPQMRRAAAAKPPGLIVVAIPVRNEVERIARCLRALERQENVTVDRVVLLLNNCTDGTQACVRALLPDLRIAVEIVARDFRGNRASAGFARALAVRYAIDSLAERDVLLTTDADSYVPANWIEANLAALHDGADAVCGHTVLDPVDALAIPPHLREDDARETMLASLLDELAFLVDPDPFDPWPRHSEHSGASLAAAVSTWRRAGGIPAAACGEDRAFVGRLRQIDARVRHAPEVTVTVSGRTLGRAEGGMADTIRRRLVQQDEFADDALEPAADRYRRISLRAMACLTWRARGAGREALMEALDTAPKIVRAALAAPFFGQAWATLERASPVLRPRGVRFVELASEIETARAIRAQLLTAAAPDMCQTDLVTA